MSFWCNFSRHHGLKERYVNMPKNVKSTTWLNTKLVLQVTPETNRPAWVQPIVWRILREPLRSTRSIKETIADSRTKTVKRIKDAKTSGDKRWQAVTSWSFQLSWSLLFPNSCKNVLSLQRQKSTQFMKVERVVNCLSTALKLFLSKVLRKQISTARWQNVAKNMPKHWTSFHQFTDEE